MFGYTVSVYLSGDIGEKFVSVLKKLESIEESRISVSECIRRAVKIYSEALGIYLENKDKFKDLNEFDNWLTEIIKDIKSKVAQVPPEDFMRMMELVKKQ